MFVNYFRIHLISVNTITDFSVQKAHVAIAT